MVRKEWFDKAKEYYSEYKGYLYIGNVSKDELCPKLSSLRSDTSWEDSIIAYNIKTKKKRFLRKKGGLDVKFDIHAFDAHGKELKNHLALFARRYKKK